MGALTSVFTNFNQNLTKFEGVLVAILSVQAIAVQFVAGTPAVERIVQTAFGVIAIVSALVVNYLGNTGGGSTPIPAPPAPKP